MYFVGIDLAWSGKNTTGIAILKAGKTKAELCCADMKLSDSEILDYISNTIKDKNAFVAIDAPLVVQNKQGRRRAEELVGMLFRKYDAGAHPANRQRLSSWTGTIRGEEISKLLESNNFKHSPYITKHEESRKFFEVYPHPSMVVLFNLDKILRYKAKPKRDYDFRYNEFRKYQYHLKNLQNPSLILPNNIISKNVRLLKAQKLKDYEDILDAIFCAYIAYYAWKYPDKCAVLGDLNEGYILTPVFSNMQEQLKMKQKELNDF